MEIVCLVQCNFLLVEHHFPIHHAYTHTYISTLSPSPQLSEAFLSSLEKLMVLLFQVLPHLPPDLHMPTYYAVMRLIVGVTANRNILQSFLSHIGVCTVDFLYIPSSY